MVSSVRSPDSTSDGQPQALPIGMEPWPVARRPSFVSTSTSTLNNVALATTRPPNLIGVRYSISVKLVVICLMDMSVSLDIVNVSVGCEKKGMGFAEVLILTIIVAVAVSVIIFSVGKGSILQSRRASLNIK